jgi:hypothetical protein
MDQGDDRAGGEAVEAVQAFLVTHNASIATCLLKCNVWSLTVQGMGTVASLLVTHNASIATWLLKCNVWVTHSARDGNCHITPGHTQCKDCNTGDKPGHQATSGLLLKDSTL